MTRNDIEILTVMHAAQKVAGRVMMTEQKKAEASLADRLQAIEKQEKKLLKLIAPTLQPGQPFSASGFHGHLFIIGAGKRTVAQSAGFRNMIGSRNFVCASSILRMQIDTAMRLNALNLVADVPIFLEAWSNGEKFSKLKSAAGNKLHDTELLKELAVKFPWVQEVYAQTSAFIHFSARHTWACISQLNEQERTFRLEISPEDPERPEHDYFEIVSCFSATNDIIGTLVGEVI